MRESDTSFGSTNVLPPKALLVSLVAQAPLAALAWPLAPTSLQAIAGAAMLLGGTVLNVWAERLFRRAGVGVCPFSAAPRMVTSGPYRFTRNPMYLGMVMVSAGAALATGVLPNLVWCGLLGGWLHRRFVLPEEAFLTAKLGAEFERYRAAHPRWLGVPSVRSSADTRDNGGETGPAVAAPSVERTPRRVALHGSTRSEQPE